MLAQLTVGGFRGISQEQTLEFAQPNGKPGSGLTVLVGTNNAGKSTFVEALRLLGTDLAPHFGTGARNLMFGDEVRIRVEAVDGGTRSIESVRPGGSATKLIGEVQVEALVVPSRRAVEARFGMSLGSRRDYARVGSVQQLRTAVLGNFALRLFELDKDEEKRKVFGELLQRILGYEPRWAVDTDDGGQFYLKFVWEGESGVQTHTSEGMGDGLISLFVILDALRDAGPGSATVIDEPELSLHPQFQRRLRALMSDLSVDRQIIYSTHSPYFINWDDIGNGARVIRVFKTPKGTATATPTVSTLEAVRGVSESNQFNPHVLGLDANEVFFLEGGVLLTEGQEDVVILPRVLDQVYVRLSASYFGWGSGGATNMGKVCQLVHELGYPKVVGVLDNDMTDVRDKLAEQFPNYQFVCVPAADIRDKAARKAADAKSGLVDSKLVLKNEHKDAVKQLFESVATYFEAGPPSEIL